MRVIALVTQKGGSGKSTLCIGLAVAAHQAGASTCILEMDRQGTVSDWSALRRAEGPEVARVDASRLDAVLGRLAAFAFDHVFIDTPGIDSPGTLAAIRAADLCVVPARPTPADLRAVQPTLAAIYRLDKRFTFVLNQAPARSERVREAARALIALGVLPDVNVVLRNDHQDAVGCGQGVTELNPGGRAADEIRRLWSWIADRAAAEQTSRHGAVHAKAA